MEVPYAEQDAFKFNGYCYNSTATLHVQVGTKNQYAIADVWKDFKNIVEHTEIITGDANSDSKVDIVDVTMTISEILGQNPTGFNKTAADVNGDGRVDIVDVTSIIDIILKAK